MSFIEHIEARRKYREEQKKEIKATNEKVDKIKEHWSTILINYPEHQEAFDYVDELFPHCDVKNVTVYKANRDFLAKLGFKGVGGFCHKKTKSVVLSSHSREPIVRRSRYQVFAIIEPDEVIVHELIHYCYFFEKNTGRSLHLNEEFAYGYSIGYLRSKGFSDEDIIKKNFLPYLYKTAEDRIAVDIILKKEKMPAKNWHSLSNPLKEMLYKKYLSDIYDRAIKASYKRGHKIIDIYTRKIEDKRGVERESVVDEPSATKFDFLDI
tara:strand:+ start:40104 stop:40901 length:798 start_codon:yes stop_codon:yes gene_type:complete